MTACRGCGRDIEWVRTPAGKAMPVDPERVEVIPGLHVDGHSPQGQRQAAPETTIITDDGRVVRGVRAEHCPPELLGRGLGLVVTAGRIPHWATCPNADRFRGRGQVELRWFWWARSWLVRLRRRLWLTGAEQERVARLRSYWDDVAAGMKGVNVRGRTPEEIRRAFAAAAARGRQSRGT